MLQRMGLLCKRQFAQFDCHRQGPAQPKRAEGELGGTILAWLMVEPLTDGHRRPILAAKRHRNRPITRKPQPRRARSLDGSRNRSAANSKCIVTVCLAPYTKQRIWCKRHICVLGAALTASRMSRAVLFGHGCTGSPLTPA